MLLTEIKTRFEHLFVETTIVSAQQVYNASDFSSESVSNRYQQFIAKHLQGLYKKQKYVKNYAHTNEELRAS